jgi:hypothetical protein
MTERRHDPEDGVSVIIGTLMLILITVTAAAGLAIMVSELQKDEMARQSHQAAVRNEELIIHGIVPYYNNTTLERLTITILNMNTADSRMQLVGVSEGTRDSYPANFTSGGITWNNTNARLEIPATRQATIELNMTTNFSSDPVIGSDDPLRIWVITSYYNTFERSFRAPTADFTFSIEKEDLGAAERDLIVLDGSPSSDDGSLVNWSWVVEDGSGTVPIGNWSDTARLILSPVAPGKVSRFYPLSSGPFRITLTVTDESGMKDTTDPKVIPKNTRFFPPTYLEPFTRSVSNTTQIVAAVKDLQYNPVQGATVMFLKVQDVYGNLTLDRWSGMTDSSGEFSANITQGTGTIRVSSGKISPVDIPVTA